MNEFLILMWGEGGGGLIGLAYTHMFDCSIPPTTYLPDLLIFEAAHLSF